VSNHEVAQGMTSNGLTKEEETNLAFHSSVRSIATFSKKYRLTKTEKSLIKRHFVNRDARVLDIGCGSGRTTVPLKNMGMDVTGIDLSKEMIDAAKSRFNEIDFRIMNACDLKFEPESFDYILFSFNGIDCIYPEEKRILALKEAYRVLKREGIFIFSAHNSWWLPLGLYPVDLPYFIITLGCNLINLRMFRKYRIERTRAGTLILYYISPPSQERQLRDLGFETIETVGEYGRLLKYSEPYLHYVVKKG